MSADIEEIYSRLLTQNYQETLFRDLEKFKQSGSEYIACCPFHDDKNPSFSISADKPLWNCFTGCGGGDWIGYLMRKEGLDFIEALNHFANAAGVKLDAYNQEKWERETEKVSILEAGLDFFKEQLWTEKGKEALEYLKGRGYSEDDIKLMELGYYPGYKVTSEYLVNKDYPVNTVNSHFKWLNIDRRLYREDYKVVIPYRDSIGRLKGVYGRLIRPLKEGEKEVDKYKPFTDAEGIKDTPFLMDRARGKKDLVVVEGYLDALICNAKGIDNVIAIGQASPKESQLETAVKYEAKNFILALDNDEAGQKGIEKAIELIVGKGLKAYVVTLPDGYKDPDELIKAQGIDSFKDLIENAQAGVKWKANWLVSKHSLLTDRGRAEALNEALSYEERLRDPIDSKDFLDVITKALGIPIELLQPKISTYHEKKARERLESDYRVLFKKGERLLGEGKITELREYMDEVLPGLRAKSVSRTIEPYRLENLQEDITQTREGLETGYESLDKIVTIPQEAITIIAARPSHGKTTLLLNLFLNMIKKYPRQVFIFFSYEESKRQLGLKILNILSGEIINEYKNLIQIENYLRGNNTSRENIEKGKAEYKGLTESNRLWIIDEPYYVDDLADTLAYLSERYDIGAVFIDYIQKIKIKGRYGTRQIELQKISERILETAKDLSLPIILGAQLGRDKERREKVRLDNLREAGDIEQDANLVIGLDNEAMENAQADNKPLRESIVNLKLTILKNRNGIVNEKTILEFNRPILTIKDPEKEEHF